MMSRIPLIALVLSLMFDLAVSGVVGPRPMRRRCCVPSRPLGGSLLPRRTRRSTKANLSALEWILDQYKEKTPKDPTICERFNTYRFADYKEKVIDLLIRVTRVSVETMKVVGAMRMEKR